MKKSHSPHRTLFAGFRESDIKVNGTNFIHRVSFHYKSDARKELKKRKAKNEIVVMRKYKDKNGIVHYGIFKRSELGFY